MPSRTQQFQEQPQDLELWKKLYYQHQQEYIRNKLKAIKYLWEGKSRPEVAENLGCSYKTLTSWIDQFIQGGLVGLTKPITHQVQSRLTLEHQMELKRMILEQKPTDYGIDRYIWTGAILCEVIQKRWDVELKDSRVYELLKELGLSYQKGHRDYANADAQVQKSFVEQIKKNWRDSRMGRK
jgi:transposase